MEPPNEFTITISDQVFILTLDQIHRDAPNYFTAFFAGSFQESNEGVRELKLYRDPYLFKFIHLYLTGYDVFPLPKHNIPSYFSEGSRLTNLLLDARFYGLDSLAQELEAEIHLKKKSEANDLGAAKGEEVWKLL